MGDINLNSALGKLSAGQVAARTSGLAEIRRILEYNKGSSKLERITDKTWHQVFQALFQLASNERSKYAKTGKDPSNFLSACGHTFSVVVRSSVRNIRSKTLHALLDHIIQTLPLTGGRYCEPLALHYLNSLGEILEYQPHVEHLQQERWCQIVDFCLNGLEMLINDGETQDSNGLHLSRGQSLGASHRSSRSGSRVARERTPNKDDTNKESTKLFFCLRHITKAPNAPVLSRADRIVSSLIVLMRSTKATIDALAAINNVLSCTAFESVTSTREHVQGLLPLLKDAWATTREPALRNEVLATLIFCIDHIEHIMQHYPDQLDDISALVEVMFGEYCKRQEKDQLRLDDISYRSSLNTPIKQMPLRVRGFALKAGSNHSEQHWLFIYLVARISSAIDSVKMSKVPNDGYIYEDVARPKRPRAYNHLMEYARQIAYPDLQTRISSLQIVAFFAEFSSLPLESLRELLEKLTTAISDDNHSVASWAMLALVNCAFNGSSKDSTLSPAWAGAWQLASRNISATATCRAACLLLETLLRLKLVKYGDVTEAAESIVSSVELNGPALFADSSSSFWEIFLASAVDHSPGVFNSMSDRVLEWLFSKWTPSNFEDRSYTLHSAQLFELKDIIRIICVCTDREMPAIDGLPFTTLGPLGQTYLKYQSLRPMIEYLLLIGPSGKPTLSERDADIASATGKRQSQSRRLGKHSMAIESMLFNFFHSELQKAGSAWKECATVRPQSINSNVMRLLTSLCMSAHLLVQQEFVGASRKVQIQTAAESLTQAITGFLSREDCERANVDAVLDVFLYALPDLSQNIVSACGQVARVGGLYFVLHLHKALSTRKSLNPDDKLDAAFDSMEIEDDFESQGSNSRSRITGNEQPRDDIRLSTDPASVRECVAAYLAFLSSAAQSSSDDSDTTTIPSGFIQYLELLSAPSFLACRYFVAGLLNSMQITTADTERLLEALGVIVLEGYEYDRCEPAIGLTVDVMAATTSTWTVSESESLLEAAEDIYRWLVEKVLDTGEASPNVQKCFAELLQSLLIVFPDYGSALQSLPSPRTSLFGLLRSPYIQVKYHVAKRIPETFKLFVLAKHEAIFNDVRDSLPQQSDWIEGLLMRLLVFSRLAAAWQTLLRLCVYHIFETAANVPSTVGHAARCISEISRALGLDQPQTLFKLLGRQLLYTWLHSLGNSLESVPFSIFGFGTLKDLLIDAEDELAGLLAMSRDTAGLENLASLLHKTTSDIMQRCFAKASAYCIAEDTSSTKARTKGAPTSESQMLGDYLGQEAYLENVEKHSPRILGLFFLHMNEVETFEKNISKRSQLQPASEILREIKEISCSSMILPPGQQPSFLGRYLWDEIERLYRRFKLSPPLSWDPSVFVYVLRMLLCDIVPALGSLHACSTIRKIRVLVCLAGKTILSGYALEMAIHALRPFITDHQCADDALGIVQYLYNHGKPYLLTNLPFVTGNALSILISSHAFLGSSQDTTTQETQHLATLSKVSSFRAWFTNYVDTIPRGDVEVHLFESFRAMTKAAREIRSEGNAYQGTPEAKLLLGLLDDQQSGRNLLTSQARAHIYRLLCSKFQATPIRRNDIIHSDMLASTFFKQVWESCGWLYDDTAYLAWAARVLGRAFGCEGGVLPHLQRHDAFRPSNLKVSGKATHESQAEILAQLSELLLSDNRLEVGLAEETLRSMLVKSSKTSDGPDVEGDLHPSVVSCLSCDSPDYILQVPGVLPVSVLDCTRVYDGKSPSLWFTELAISLTRSFPGDAFLESLAHILPGLESLTEKLFPYIVHLALYKEMDTKQEIRSALSEACEQWFSKNDDEDAMPFKRLLIKTILYLRKQAFPRESTHADREKWLEINRLSAARAALSCGMPKAALLFAEIHAMQQPRSTHRRSSALPPSHSIPLDLMASIFKEIDEPDSYYGIQYNASLDAVLDRLDYEGGGFRGLLLRSARLDSQMRRVGNVSPLDSHGAIQSLIALNMNSLTTSLLSNQENRGWGSGSVDDYLHAARKLEQWDLKVPGSKVSEASVVFRAFQGISNAPNIISARQQINDCLCETLRSMLNNNVTPTAHRSYLRALAVLSEIDDAVSCNSFEELQESWEIMQARQSWMQSSSIDDVRPILSCRGTLFSVLGRDSKLQDSLCAKPRDLRNIEVQSLLLSSSIARNHGASEESLAIATYLSDLLPTCRQVGLYIDAAAQLEAANVLRDQGETLTSIQMLQSLNSRTDIQNQTTPVGKSHILATLAHQVAEARSEKPQDIMNSYLSPAIKELQGKTKGSEAGRVFHEFASFCDRQLQNPDSLEDFNRMQKLKDRRQAEVAAFMDLAKKTRDKAQRDAYKHSISRARKWFELDNQEWQKLQDSREDFLRLSLENYLLSLQASDEHDDDVLRFFALWLEWAQVAIANSAVKSNLQHIPSRKFAILMNQMTSRLQAEDTEFQNLLADLVFRVCLDHPYHGMPQIYAGANSYNVTDAAAASRTKATKEIMERLKKDNRSFSNYRAVHNSSNSYHNLAMEKKAKPGSDDNANFVSGHEYPLEKHPKGRAMTDTVPNLKVPPATMKIELRADCDYKNVPIVTHFRSKMRIANGLSCPKIITAVASDGKQYKQLLKGGNDDLRQDAIMEQVFEQVNTLLKKHTSTRQRDLHIRTYKVLPLTSSSGILEFVPHTIALHDFLMPAHERYYPRDIKNRHCRDKITSCKDSGTETRVKVFKDVCDRFNPVGRFFFLERFKDTDVWFKKRLAYTRSTAAISILGHILGLGDRHCHNILLDEHSGEIVHIDLGVAFEAGRVLPIPEVVPFRLTRDLVDAMGYTRTEGVFRRCCEFTLEALREERESIMTLLNVLRYDPLYNWSVSPLKAKRMQDDEEQNDDMAVQPLDKREDEAGEAGRALSVVEKKLSKTLSVQATVNELIQQATDERNLAVLYSGWAAYA